MVFFFHFFNNALCVPKTPSLWRATFSHSIMFVLMIFKFRKTFRKHCVLRLVLAKTNENFTQLSKWTKGGNFSALRKTSHQRVILGIRICVATNF